MALSASDSSIRLGEVGSGTIADEELPVPDRGGMRPPGVRAGDRRALLPASCLGDAVAMGYCFCC